jgi:N-acyl-D-amino-acid deacylase
MSYAVVSSCSAYPQYVGRNIKQVAQMMQLTSQNKDKELLAPTTQSSNSPMPDVTMDDQYRAVIDIFLHGGASMVFHTLDESDVINILRCPLISIASDSGVREFGTGQPHPRGYGTNARVLGHYVRELHVITLEDAIRKMTSQPATVFRFSDRGLLREGFVADVTIFDADRVIDKATFEQPHQYSEGIVDVIVNGKLVLGDGKMTGTLPGKPIYGPGHAVSEPVHQ